MWKSSSLHLFAHVFYPFLPLVSQTNFEEWSKRFARMENISLLFIDIALHTCTPDGAREEEEEQDRETHYWYTNHLFMHGTATYKVTCVDTSENFPPHTFLKQLLGTELKSPVHLNELKKENGKLKGSIQFTCLNFNHDQCKMNNN